jgi:hypothetical protein
MPLFAGCETIAAVDRADIIAAVAVATANVLHEPTPEVPQEGCEPGCKCNGTGEEETGDGLAIVPCRCDDDCECKQKKDSRVLNEPAHLDSDEPPLVPVQEPQQCESGNCEPSRTVRRWRLFR